MPSAGRSEFSSRLSRLTFAFNLAPAHYVDPSWLPQGWSRFEAIGTQLHARTAAALSRWLLQQHALADQFDFDFAAPDKRIALLDRSALQQLAYYLGLALHARSVRTVVERTARAALVNRIGVEAYQFAMTATPAALTTGDIPGIDPLDAALDAKLRISGARRLLAMLDAAPVLQRRVQLKLPRAAAASPESATPTQSAAARHALISHLIPKVTPQWAWLF